MVEDFDKYMALAKILNTTWSTGSQGRKSLTTQSIKYQLRDDKSLKASVMMSVVIPNTNRLAIEMKHRFHEEALSLLKSGLQELAKEFKENNDGKSIVFKIIPETVMSGVEFLTNSQYRPTKNAYFRLDALVVVE